MSAGYHPCGCPCSTGGPGTVAVWWRDRHLIVECLQCGATWLADDVWPEWGEIMERARKADARREA